MTNNEIATNSQARHRRPLLWTALVVTALCNAAASLAGLTAVGIVFGFLVLLCGAGLVVEHRRR
ncbi:hypothetical protein [Lentzea cavernae]|nr:hypothetical protein [Lentzea cavernae]